VKAQSCASGGNERENQAFSIRCGGATTKIHAVTDRKGRPPNIASPAARATIVKRRRSVKRRAAGPGRESVDKAYDSEKARYALR